jgi:hypothetical protein
MMKDGDSDKDGMIDFEEFKRLMPAAWTSLVFLLAAWQSEQAAEWNCCRLGCTHKVTML